MTDEPRACPSPVALAVAERQLALLGELAGIAMAVSRAFGDSAMASAGAEKRILADEYFMPEVGRARACGAKDAAESFQKASRAARLTMKLEMAVAEVVDALREGRPLPEREAGETPALRLRDSISPPERRPPAGSSSDDETPDRERHDSDHERLVDVERGDTLPRAVFHEAVEGICSDLGATVDWADWKVAAPVPGVAAPEPERFEISPEPFDFPVPPWRLDPPAAIGPPHETAHPGEYRKAGYPDAESHPSTTTSVVTELAMKQRS